VKNTPKNTPIKVVVDVNVWGSFLRKDSSENRCRLFMQPPCLLLYSDALLSELDEVVHRPKHWNVIEHSKYERLLMLIKDIGTKVNVQSIVTDCADPKDNYLLALAEDGGAAFIITGDKKVQAIKQFGATKIASLTEFANLFSV
jgi:putative PIN family toxin of toxin-antitoxin system